MRVFVYEHLTDGDGNYAPSMMAEGLAMRRALTADLIAAAHVVVESHGRTFEQCLDEADAVLLIAPETDGVLSSLASRVEQANKHLLSPLSLFCEWASDKSRVAATLQAAGVPVPQGVLIRSGERLPAGFPFPAVLKPNDGCGSQSVRLVGNALRGVPFDLRNATEGVPYRLEQFVPGTAASVALLRGPNGVYHLPACSQRLSIDGMFAYLSGSCPLPSLLAARADLLALRTAAVMPEGYGYIGVDLVLGPTDDGSEDYVIEVNPRLTTSYIGLRVLAETNLAQAMLDVVAGREPALSFRLGTVEFDADGTVREVAERVASDAAK